MGVILLVAGIGLCAAWVSALLSRKEYASTAVVGVHQAPAVCSVYDTPTRADFEMIRSEAVLADVIATLDLNELWGKKYNHGQSLSDARIEAMLRMEIRRMRKTPFIQITVFDVDPVEAATLANAISHSFRDFKTEEVKRLSKQGADPFDRFPRVDIVKTAVPGTQPVLPNYYLVTAMLGLGVFLTIGGIVYLKNSEA